MGIYNDERDFAFVVNCESLVGEGTGGYGMRVAAGSVIVMDVRLEGDTHDIRIDSGATVFAYGLQYETVNNLGTLEALYGDRAARDVANYPTRHASDIESGLEVYHNPSGASVGQAPVWDGDEWLATDIATQAEIDAIKDESFVVMAATADLTNERVLTAGSGITITDGGAGGNVTIAADSVTPGHVHGLARWEAAASQTTFDLPDVAEYADGVYQNGLQLDPSDDYSLSANQDQIVLITGATAGDVLASNYVIAQV